MAKKKKVLKKSGPRSPRSRLFAMKKISASFASWEPAGKVFETVKAVPTIFPQYDIGTRVGGHPIQRVSLIHGPSGHGKTAFALGLGHSFLARDHFFGLVDAEFTTPEGWLQQLMKENADHPGFVGIRPSSYEEVVESVRDMVKKIAAAVKSGDLPSDTSALIVVDSLRKLVPAGLMKKILADGNGVDGAKGRAAQMKAALNAAWLDELVPLLYQTNTALLLIARESENPNAGPWDPKFRVGGGKAVLYDASIGARIQRAGWVKVGEQIVGERHRVRIHKTKVGGKSDKDIVCHFHTSNGVHSPAGFDRARDVVELAIAGGQVKRSGAWYEQVSTGERWNGEAKMVASLTASPPTLDLLEQEVRDHAAGLLNQMEIDPDAVDP